MSDNKIIGEWQGKRFGFEDKEKSTFNFLVNRLRKLHENYGVIGIKQSFEDEGAILADVLTMRRITELCDLKMYVKVGGCEAITDINNCATMGIDSIIPPMIETPYAFQKFASAVKNIENTEFYFLCETKTAFSNLDSILKTPEASILSGVILGRSDFTKSYGKEKSKVNSRFIANKVKKAFLKAKSKNLKTTMGGNISLESSEFIKELFSLNLLDKIETRNIVVELSKNNVDNLEETITEIISYEIDWLTFKAQNYNNIGSAYEKRSEILKNRAKK